MTTFKWFAVLAILGLPTAAFGGWHIVQEQTFVGATNVPPNSGGKTPHKSKVVTDFDGSKMRINYAIAEAAKTPFANFEIFYAQDDVFYFCFGKAGGGANCVKDTMARLLTASQDLGDTGKSKYKRFSVEATGKKRTLSGIKCNEFVIEHELVVEIMGKRDSHVTRENACHAAEIVPKVSAKAMKEVDSMYATLAEPAAMAGLKKYGTLGMALEVTPLPPSTKGPIEGRKLTLVSATAKAFPASHFQLPPGYVVSKDGIAGLATAITPEMLQGMDPESMRAMGLSEKDIEAYKAAMGKASQLKATKPTKKSGKSNRKKPAPAP